MAYAMTGMELLQAMEEKEQAEMKARREHRDLVARLQKLVAARYTMGATILGRCNGRDCDFILQHAHAMPANNGNGVIVELKGPIIKKDGTRGRLFGHKYEDITMGELDSMQEPDNG